ncbi:MAG: flippase-like domain-containing protein [Actinomycetota bacterium]
MIDLPVARFMLEHRSPGVTQFMAAFTHLGDAAFVFPVALLVALLVVWKLKSIQAATFLLAAVGGGTALARLLKLLLHRARPSDPLVMATGYSFPSTHVVAAVTLSCGIAFILSRRAIPRLVKSLAWIIAVSVSALMAVSRVYLGVHWTSDVIGGAAMGAVWLAACAGAWLAWERFGDSEPHRAVRRHVAGKSLKWAILAFSLGLLAHLVLLGLPGIRESASALGNLHPALLIAALACEIAANGCLAQVYRECLRALGKDVGYRESLRISMGSFTVGRALPGGGAAAGVYAVRGFTAAGVGPSTAATSVLTEGLVTMAVLGVLVFVGSIASLFRGDLPPGYLITISLVLALFAAAGLVAVKVLRSSALRVKVFTWGESMLRHAGSTLKLEAPRRFIDEVAHDLPPIPRLLRASAWSAVNWLLDAAALWLLFLGFGFRMHIGVLMVGYGVANLISAFPVTPGGLGLVEAGLVGTYTAFDVPAGVAVVAVLGYRLISYWLPVLAGIPAYLKGAGRRDAPVTGDRRAELASNSSGADA